VLGLFKKTRDAVKRTRDSWFSKVSNLLDRQALDESLWEDLEELLLSADVGVSTTDKLISSMKEKARQQKIHDVAGVRSALKQEMVDLLRACPYKGNSDGGPRVIMVVGVNGSGKTTSIAKLSQYYRETGKTVLLAAADTFRAAAIEQLQIWANRVGVEIVAGKQGSDPGAVVFDALSAAATRKPDMVIIDTAGRLHTKFNLMEELKKVKRIASRSSYGPVDVVLVLDATTGQNGLSQARHFTEAVDVSGVLLSKLDGTAKGGIVLAICEELKLPRIKPKGKHRITSERDRYSGVRQAGPESLRHFKRTFRRALRRQIMAGLYNPDSPRIIFERGDKVYRSWKTVLKPQSNAVIIYMMDVSGSMGDEQKELVRLEAFWIDAWLRKNYQGIESRYIVHDVRAGEVDRETFFRIREDGGTRISSAFRLAREQIGRAHV